MRSKPFHVRSFRQSCFEVQRHTQQGDTRLVPDCAGLGQEFLEGLSQSSQTWLRRSLQEMDAAISAQPLVTTALAAHMATKPAQAPVATVSSSASGPAPLPY